MEVLWLKSRGLTHTDIAQLADVSPRSVQRYLDEFEQGGLVRVRRLGWQGKTCALNQ
jgi:DNA-binding IclR family transcriptional regulator